MPTPAQRPRDPGTRAPSPASAPYLGRRLLLESEAVAMAFASHNAASAQSFICEVFRRSYWKGWLELHQGALTSYRTQLAATPLNRAANRQWRSRAAASIPGRGS
ncbi:MAG: hypothetical protein JWP04_3629 [Belnapia sp.]|nr:hypothetical protein [Belnapia sp.]